MVAGTDCSAQPQTRIVATLQAPGGSSGVPWRLAGPGDPGGARVRLGVAGAPGLRHDAAVSSSAARSLPPTRATYADLEAVPGDKVAELIRGTLVVMPRPAARHARASSALTMEIGGPFDRGRGSPGGWVILDEPELHFPDPTAPLGADEFGALVLTIVDIANNEGSRFP